jgi:MFS family permease
MPLRRNRDFQLLWAGQSVSKVGTEVSVLAIPLIAISVLHATTFQVGALTAIEFLPFLLVGLPAGAWVDRLRRRRVLIVADAGRLLSLGSIPLAHSIASLTLVHLFIAAFVTGALTVFFDVAYQSYLPELVEREQLVEGNAKLAATESAAHVVGPGLGGGLVAAVGASTAVVADAISYAVSLACLLAIRAPGDEPERHPDGERPSLVHDIREGLRYVWHEHRIRAVAFTTATSNLFGGMGTAVVLLFMSRQLGFGSGEIGLVFAFGGVGAVVGSVAAPLLAKRIGVGHAIVAAIVFAAVGALFIASAGGSFAPVLLSLGIGIEGGGGVAYNVNQVSVRQALCPRRLQGRMNASVRFIVWGALPIGGFVGGALGSAIGIRETLWVSALGQLAAFVWLLPSPVPSMRDIPLPVDESLPEPVPANADGVSWWSVKSPTP